MNRQQVAEAAWVLRDGMMRVPLSILRNGADAEDALSDAILKACKNCAQLRDEERFKPWLMHITVRCCQDILRGRKRQTPLGDASAFDRPVLENEAGSIFEMIQKLPPHYGSALILHYYEGFKAREIAQILSVPTATVLVRLSRGREKLRALLEKEEAYYAKHAI